jgi:hypothetical protein
MQEHRRSDTPRKRTWQAIVGLGFALLCFLPSIAEAGAWTQPENGGYAKLWTRWQAADLFFDTYRDGAGNTHHFGDYNEVSLQSYLEYGFTDRVTGLVHFPLAMTYLFTAPNTYATATIGDPTVGGRVRLYEGWFILSAQLALRVPIAPSAPQIAVVDKDTHQVFAHLRIGQGVFDIEPRLQIGRAFAWGHAGAEIGFQKRTGGYQSRLVSVGEVGYRIDPSTYATLRVVDVARVGSAPAPYDESITGLGNGTAYFGFALEFDYRLTRACSVGAILESAAYVVRQSEGPVFDVYASWTF